MCGRDFDSLYNDKCPYCGSVNIVFLDDEEKIVQV